MFRGYCILFRTKCHWIPLYCSPGCTIAYYSHIFVFFSNEKSTAPRAMPLVPWSPCPAASKSAFDHHYSAESSTHARANAESSLRINVVVVVVVVAARTLRPFRIELTSAHEWLLGLQGRRRAALGIINP